MKLRNAVARGWEQSEDRGRECERQAKATIADWVRRWHKGELTCAELTDLLVDCVGQPPRANPLNDCRNLPPEEWADVVQELTDFDKANVLLQIVGEFTDGDNLMNHPEVINRSHREFKLFAVDIAETLGPDHCQTLYHLAVLSTKLA